MLLALAACEPQPALRPAVEDGRPAAVQRVFLATDRLMTDDPVRRAERTPGLTLAALGVGVPPDHEVGRVEFSKDALDPGGDFVLLGSTYLETGAALLAALDAAPHPEADIVVWVQGYSMTLGNAVLFRHAQLAHDFGPRGPQVTFSWPSAAEPLGYLQDPDSVVAARHDLERHLAGLGGVGGGSCCSASCAGGGADPIEPKATAPRDPATIQRRQSDAGPDRPRTRP